jgi:hypothetical protein
MRILFSVRGRRRQRFNLGRHRTACRYHVGHEAFVYVELRLSGIDGMLVACQLDS